MMTQDEARHRLDQLAKLATRTGFQVTYESRTITEGCAAGQTLTAITVSTLTVD